MNGRLKEKNWAEVRREEEEDLTSARGFYKSAQGGLDFNDNISLYHNLDPPCIIEVKQPLITSNISVRRIIATKKCELNEFFL